MTLNIRVIDRKICVCESGNGRILDIIGDCRTPCDGLIRGYEALPIDRCDANKKTYAKYRLDSALKRAGRQIADGLCPEIALLGFKSLFVREFVNA